MGSRNCFAEAKSKNAYQRSNQYLVDYANSLIAVYNPGYPYFGTAQTIRMAEKGQLEHYMDCTVIFYQ